MISIEPLTKADIPSCMALSVEAGWNQVEADWQRIVANGEVYGLRDDTLIGSGAILPYGSFGWICMILVTRPAQRRGHAMRLTQHCLGRLAERGMVAGLDATPAGRTVYLQLGFKDVYPVSRLLAARGAIADPQDTDFVLRPLSDGDLPELSRYDACAFGGNRSGLLAALRHELPQCAYVATRSDQILGYCLARNGRFATQVGPLVADTQDTACALAQAALGALKGLIQIDVPDHQTKFGDWLRARGFVKQRDFMRMLRDRSASFEQPERTMAITGPEFG